MKTGNETYFHLPTVPYSPIDALNRKASAVGSPVFAKRTENTNYNGRRVTVEWNDFRRYYVTYYYWAGRNVLSRGSFKSCLEAAVNYYNRKALGSCVSVCVREGDEESLKLARETKGLVEGQAVQDSSWWTWRHSAAAETVRDYAHPGQMRLIFDWELMQKATSRDHYVELLKETRGRSYS